MRIISKLIVAALTTSMLVTIAQAKVTTINDITLDVPDGYKSSSSTRGLLVKTPDSEVDVWVEVAKAADFDTMMKEHDRYWEKNKVLLNGDGNKTDSKQGDINVSKVDFDKATWKGDPTVLRYTFVGPLGPEKKIVVITYWASPAGDKSFGANLQKMVDSLNVKIEQ